MIEIIKNKEKFNIIQFLFLIYVTLYLGVIISELTEIYYNSNNVVKEIELYYFEVLKHCILLVILSIITIILNLRLKNKVGFIFVFNYVLNLITTIIVFTLFNKIFVDAII